MLTLRCPLSFLIGCPVPTSVRKIILSVPPDAMRLLSQELVEGFKLHVSYMYIYTRDTLPTYVRTYRVFEVHMLRYFGTCNMMCIHVRVHGCRIRYNCHTYALASSLGPFVGGERAWYPLTAHASNLTIKTW